MIVNLWMKFKAILIKIGIVLALILSAFLLGVGKENSRQRTKKKIDNEKEQKEAWRQKHEATTETNNISDDDMDKRLQQNGWLRQ
ncbi:MAG: hypothetical protein ACK5LE_06870 [Alphaproteobacteria bacterium]